MWHRPQFYEILQSTVFWLWQKKNPSGDMWRLCLPGEEFANLGRQARWIKNSDNDSDVLIVDSEFTSLATFKILFLPLLTCIVGGDFAHEAQKKRSGYFSSPWMRLGKGTRRSDRVDLHHILTNNVVQWNSKTKNWIIPNRSIREVNLPKSSIAILSFSNSADQKRVYPKASCFSRLQRMIKETSGETTKVNQNKKML